MCVNQLVEVKINIFEFCPPPIIYVDPTFCVLETPSTSTWSICYCDLYISYFYSVYTVCLVVTQSTYNYCF